MARETEERESTGRSEGNREILDRRGEISN